MKLHRSFTNMYGNMSTENAFLGKLSLKTESTIHMDYWTLPPFSLVYTDCE